jgi:hypothetical protein
MHNDMGCMGWLCASELTVRTHARSAGCVAVRWASAAWGGECVARLALALALELAPRCNLVIFKEVNEPILCSTLL